ncbi:MAG: class I adenylate-forming enzyme family protein [Acidimicrobiales bacterium]
MATRDEIEAQLTGPGAMFEVTTAEVAGIPMKVYANRFTSLREVAAMGGGRGDDQEYIVYGARRYGFSSFVALANSVSAGLAKMGVGPGDRVAILAANNPEWVLAFWGTVDLGAIVVGLNGWWKTDEILYGLQDSGAKVLIADRARFARISGEDLSGVEAVYLIDGEGDGQRVHPFDELLGEESSELPTTPIDEDDPAVIFYTSGTTGRPKGAISTHRSMIANLQNTVYLAASSAMAGPPQASQTRQTASLLTSPMFHVSGCHSGIVVGMLAGVKLVIPEGKFEPITAMQLIEDERITVWATVPTMVWRVVEHPDRANYDLTSITSVATGGSPSAGELQRQIRATFPNVTSVGNAYGLTESSSVATAISGQDFLDRPGSVGRPVPVVDIKVVDGEVWLKGPIIMPGYWGKPEATADSIVDGWLRTGDVGYVDDEGFLFITDRAKDMIIRGGENIYCVEIENRLVEHPDVLDAAVIGVAHATLGEEVKAVVEVAPGSSLDADAIKRWVAETLANFKVPAYVDFVTEKLPRNASGKLLKNVLRGEGAVSFAETM